jgi:hypothetical protein
MAELFTYVRLGFGHITDIAALDHILFLLALAAIYRPRDWRKALWVVSAFTVGHSISLALAVTDAVRLPMALIEFLIPVTIVITCVENIIVQRREAESQRGKYRPVLAGVFGLVHGAGFANYLRDLFANHVAIPLFGFNVGIEIGQVFVLLAAAVALVSIDTVILFTTRWTATSAMRLRVAAVSSIVLLVATRWAVERRPW